jgi:hypothetical protein
MINKIATSTSRFFVLGLSTVIVSFSCALVHAQNAPAKINWGATEGTTNSAPASTFRQAAPQQNAPQQATTQQSETMRANQPAFKAAAGAQSVTQKKSMSAKHLMSLDDRAIIIVSGKQTTAGAAKKVFQAEFAKKIGGVKKINSGPRRVDLSKFHVVSATHRVSTGKASVFAPPPTMHTQSLSTPAQGSDRATQGTDRAAPKVAAIRGMNHALCKDKGPPTIDKLSGDLVSGRAVGIYGRCLGEKTGSVQLIGPFPGGKMNLPFKHWDSTGVILDIPSNIRGIQDQTVSISVITAEGKATSALPAKFVAARESVDVPERFWAPTAGFGLEEGNSYDTVDTGTLNLDFQLAFNANHAYQGMTPKTLRVNPQCALDTMAVDAQAGSILNISGWENGPPNEANISIKWQGACQGMAHTLHTIGVSDGERTINASCKVSFKVSAKAYCPLGISP